MYNLQNQKSLFMCGNKCSKIYNTLHLKVVCQETFDLHFFHDSNPSRPLINRLKHFLIQFRFRKDIQIFKKLSGVHHTAESSSAVCIISRSQAPWCASHRRVKLRGVWPLGMFIHYFWCGRCIRNPAPGRMRYTYILIAVRSER